jgi:hypothetical protein
MFNQPDWLVRKEKQTPIFFHRFNRKFTNPLYHLGFRYPGRYPGIRAAGPELYSPKLK